MLKQVTITTNTTTQIGTVVKKRDFYTWQATLFATGTFGGATIAWKWSFNGGTTKLPITSAPGTAVTSTAEDAFNIQLGTGNKNSDQVILYAVTTGGSGINLVVGFEDNN